MSEETAEQFAGLVRWLLSGHNLADLKNDPGFEMSLDMARFVARTLLDEIGRCVETNGRTVADVLAFTAPVNRQRRRFAVLNGGSR